MNPLITTLPAAFGLIMGVVGAIFYTGNSAHPFWRRFYTILPGIVLCCFVPAGLNSAGVFAPELGKQIYSFAATYLLRNGKSAWRVLLCANLIAALHYALTA